MASLSSLYQRLRALPEGYLSKKTIHGKVYFYHQFFADGALRSRYVNSEEAERLKEQFAEKQEILQEIKAIHSSAKKVGSLSKSATAFDGYLMSGDRVVATFDHGALVSMDEKRCPFIIQRTKLMECFLSKRVIDSSRSNAKLLKKALGIQEKDDEKIALYAYGASIGDDYWFRPRHSKLKYADICFDNDIYAELSLTGKMILLPSGIHLTPELSTRGAQEKGWKRKGKHWVLYKKESDEQIFSELLSCQLARALGIPTAEYHYEEPYIASTNFAEGVNFEPIVSYLGEDEEYEYVYRSLLPLGKGIADQYLNLMRFDALVYNVDRHNENYGLLRDKDSGEVLSLAPNFDNNLCLLGYQGKLPETKKDGLLRRFLSFATKNAKARDCLANHPLPPLSEEEILSLIDALPLPCPIEKEGLAHQLKERIDYLNYAFSIAGIPVEEE